MGGGLEFKVYTGCRVQGFGLRAQLGFRVWVQSFPPGPGTQMIGLQVPQTETLDDFWDSERVEVWGFEGLGGSGVGI